MKSEQKLRDITLRLIQVLVWFLILWAVVFLAGLVFQWSGLTDQLAAAFFGSGFCAVMVLAALALLNMTANLNIISKAQVRAATGEDSVSAPESTFIKNIAAAAALIVAIVLSLWLAEWRLHRAKVSETETQIASVIGTSLLDNALDVIRNDGTVAELAAVRDALSASIQSGARLSFIITRPVKDVPIYYEFTAWWFTEKDSDTRLSEARINRFIPRDPERRRWERLTDGQIDHFTVPVRSNLRSFRRIISEEVELIILVDTSRRSDYSRSSFK